MSKSVLAAALAHGLGTPYHFPAVYLLHSGADILMQALGPRLVAEPAPALTSRGHFGVDAFQGCIAAPLSQPGQLQHGIYLETRYIICSLRYCLSDTGHLDVNNIDGCLHHSPA